MKTIIRCKIHSLRFRTRNLWLEARRVSCDGSVKTLIRVLFISWGVRILGTLEGLFHGAISALPTRDSPLGWGLGEGLATHHKKRSNLLRYVTQGLGIRQILWNGTWTLTEYLQGSFSENSCKKTL